MSQYNSDAKPREIFLTACLLLLMIGIGFYPKLLRPTHDVKTLAVTTHVNSKYN